jgi:hypothetical protein
MSGAILNVVYGIPLCGKFGGKIRMSEELEEAIENEEGGFRQYYSAYDESPAAFGIELCSIHESGVVEVGDIRLEPTAEEFGKFVSEWNKLEESLQAELAKLGSPRVFAIWSNS